MQITRCLVALALVLEALFIREYCDCLIHRTSGHLLKIHPYLSKKAISLAYLIFLEECDQFECLSIPGDGISFKQDMEKWAEWQAPGCVAVSSFPAQSLFRHSVQGDHSNCAKAPVDIVVKVVF